MQLCRTLAGLNLRAVLVQDKLHPGCSVPRVSFPLHKATRFLLSSSASNPWLMGTLGHVH